MSPQTCANRMFPVRDRRVWHADGAGSVPRMRSSHRRPRPPDGVRYQSCNGDGIGVAFHSGDERGLYWRTHFRISITLLRGRFRNKHRLNEEVLLPPCPPCIPDMYISVSNKPTPSTVLESSSSPKILPTDAGVDVSKVSLVVDVSNMVTPRRSLSISQYR